jgi:hypothetical protein
MQYMSTAVTFRLPDELVEQLRSYSADAGVPQARVVADALRAKLNGSLPPSGSGDRSVLTTPPRPASEGASAEGGSGKAERLTRARAVKAEAEGAVSAPERRYRCPRDCDPSWRPRVPIRCNVCRSLAVPA